MPLYDYQCLNCGAQEALVAALDDHTAICLLCGGLMQRRAEDLFQPYFPEADNEDHLCLVQ
jgi:putative FmdB family regulatory protein